LAMTRRKASVIIFMRSTEGEFFARGRHIAQLADAGKPIPKQTIISIEATDSEVMVALARRRNAIAPVLDYLKDK